MKKEGKGRFHSSAQPLLCLNPVMFTLSRYRLQEQGLAYMFWALGFANKESGLRASTEAVRPTEPFGILSQNHL